MTLRELHHCSIRTDKLEATKDFFVGALGMEVGERPAFPFPGYWLYAEGSPVVHLVGIDPDDPEGLVKYLGDAAMDGPTGAFDHMAFNISEPSPLRKHLKNNKIPFKERVVPDMNLQQFFLEDPNGVTVELNYFATQEAPDIIAKPTLRERIIGAARELIPDLQARAVKAEKARRIPKATLNDLRDTGLWRIIQPTRLGGFELDYAAILEASYELSQGCGSTGWVFVNLASHHWMVAMFPERGQEDVWGNDPSTRTASSVIFPAGNAKKVKGGYELSGRWPFCSGILHSKWVMVGGMVKKRTNGEPPEPLIFLVPTHELELIDTWDVGGLAATSSLDTSCENVFVPAHRTLAANDIRGGPTPGSIVNPSPLYQLPVAALFPHLVAAPVIGMARGIVDAACSSMATRHSTYNKSKIALHSVPQLRLSDAMAAQDAGMTLTLANCHEADSISKSGACWNVIDKLRWRRDAAYSATTAVKTTDQLYQAQGGAAIYNHNVIQRQFRDMHAGIAHIGISNDINGVAYGRATLGLEPDNPMI